MLKSTYGVGKDAVMTALKGIGADISKTGQEIVAVTAFVATKQDELTSLDISIPSITEQIEVAELSKKTAIENSLHELQLLGEQKEELSGMRNARKATMEERQKTEDFNTGASLWREVAGPLGHESYETVKSAQEKRLKISIAESMG